MYIKSSTGKAACNTIDVILLNDSVPLYLSMLMQCYVDHLMQMAKSYLLAFSSIFSTSNENVTK